MSLAWTLASRFRRSKRSNGFISFISGASTSGIALGCFVLILLLSVMNGFERELKDRLLAVIPHGELFAVSPNGIVGWRDEIDIFTRHPKVTNAEPYVKATGMLQRGAEMKAIEVTGLDVDYIQNNPWLARVDKTQYEEFESTPNGIILGSGVRQAMELDIGDEVQLLLPSVSDDLTFQAPQSAWLQVVGEISIGGELDNYIAIMHRQFAADTLNVSHGAQGVRFSFDSPFDANSAMREIGYAFNQHVYISDWTRTQGHLYQDIQLVRTVVYIALTLVIAVACFNVVSTLVMSVKDKQSEIAILKTMGAEDSLIRKAFMLQGLINGVLGIITGTFLGVIVSMNLTSIASWLEQLSGVTFLSGDIYFIDFLPSVLQWQDVVVTVLIALLLTVVATIYPAKKAASVHPAHGLNG